MLSLSELRHTLTKIDEFTIKLPDGSRVPAHFHITEAGLVAKHFIDCGGTIRKQSAITMQIWHSVDVHHRLTPQKLLKILDKAEPLFGGEDLPVEIEYQTDTIGKYHLEFDGEMFHLTATQTDCLAKVSCSVNGSTEDEYKNSKRPALTICAPDTGCC